MVAQVPSIKTHSFGHSSFPAHRKATTARKQTETVRQQARTLHAGRAFSVHAVGNSGGVSRPCRNALLVLASGRPVTSSTWYAIMHTFTPLSRSVVQAFIDIGGSEPGRTAYQTISRRRQFGESMLRLACFCWKCQLDRRFELQAMSSLNEMYGNANQGDVLAPEGPTFDVSVAPICFGISISHAM